MAEIKFNRGKRIDIQLIITLISVALTVVLFVITARLAPVVENLNNLTIEVRAFEQQTLKNEDKYVVSDTFNVLETRIDHISNRVDAIYSAILQFKK